MRAWLLTVATLAMVPAWAASPAGEVMLATGMATAKAPQGAVRELHKGSEVFAGDLIASGPNSYLDMRFADGGYVLLRPETRFRIDAYAYTPPAEAADATPAPRKRDQADDAAHPPSRALLRLLKGGLRAVSGSIGKQAGDEYQMDTPQATIGIRGTDYFAVLCESDCVTDPTLVSALPPGSAPAGSLITGVYQGGIDVRARAVGVTAVNAGDYLVTLTTGAQLKLPSLPRFLLVDPLPNPKNCAP
ncbi:MAG TPA: FecR domain-containing protein [Nevskiaceae bacterium]|nr:FecR domain-containing protein [Nevskiaceae bacterium]